MTYNTIESIIKRYQKYFTITEENANEVIVNIRNKIKKYVTDNNLKSLVIGISGGLDSAVVAALCQSKYTGVPLIGLSIPMSSSNIHKDFANWVGNEYCDFFEEFNSWDKEMFPMQHSNQYQSAYDDVFYVINQTDEIAKKAGFEPETFPKSILKGNMKARLRMITLYDLARKTNGMVLSTDNLSEFNMGFWTINGDVGDYGPIQNIGKGFELPIIAKQLGVFEEIINQKPSDGLMVTEENTDEAQLGANYKEVDFLIFSLFNKEYNKIPSSIESEILILLENISSTEKIKMENIISRFQNTSFKRNGTTNLTRKEIEIK